MAAAVGASTVIVFITTHFRFQNLTSSLQSRMIGEYKIIKDQVLSK